MSLHTPRVFAPTGTRIRAFVGDAVVADSTEAALLRTSPFKIVYGFPESDVSSEALERAERGDQPDTQGYVFIDFNAVDRWLEEDEELIGHPRDPYTRIDVRESSRHVRAQVDGVTVIDTTRPRLLMETGLPVRYYVPYDDVNWDVLVDSDTTTVCPYKGRSRYWTVRAGGEDHPDLIWAYPEPLQDAERVKGCVCFYHEKMQVTIDGEEQKRPPRYFTK